MNFLADYNFDIQPSGSGPNTGTPTGLSRRPCGSKKCTRDDCEVNDKQIGGPKFYSKSDPQETRRTGPLRCGKSYQKDHSTKGPKTVYPDPPLDITPGTSLVEDRNLFKTLDLAWSRRINKNNRRTLFLQKVRELLRDPDPPTDVNEFGMGVANLWSQRKSLTEINGVLHRTFETAEGLASYSTVTFGPRTLETVNFYFWVHGDPTSGHFGIQKTADKLQHYAYWSGWRKDVELFVRRCDTCLSIPERSDATAGSDEK